MSVSCSQPPFYLPQPPLLPSLQAAGAAAAQRSVTLMVPDNPFLACLPPSPLSAKFSDQMTFVLPIPSLSFYRQAEQQLLKAQPVTVLYNFSLPPPML